MTEYLFLNEKNIRLKSLNVHNFKTKGDKRNRRHLLSEHYNSYPWCEFRLEIFQRYQRKREKAIFDRVFTFADLRTFVRIFPYIL